MAGWTGIKREKDGRRLEYVFDRFMGGYNPGERQTDIGPWHSSFAFSFSLPFGWKSGLLPSDGLILSISYGVYIKNIYKNRN